MNTDKDREAIKEIMCGGGASFPSRTVYNYLSECHGTFGRSFDALRALRDLQQEIDLFISEIEKARQSA